MQPTDATHGGIRHNAFYLDEGDIVVRAEDTLYRFHSFHLQRATTHFDASIQSLTNKATQEGGNDARPLVLDGVKSLDFEHLLWFFYESAYRWSGIVDPALTEKWESVLLLAEKFDMRQAAKVACYALGRAGALGDVRKISLCVKHGLGKDWVIEEVKRVIVRVSPLTREEGRELGSDTTVVLAEARETLRPQVTAPATCTGASGVCPNHSYTQGTSCSAGVHMCGYYGCRRVAVCPARDRKLVQLPDVQAIVTNVKLPDAQDPTPTSSLDPRLDVAAKGNLFIKTHDLVLSLHSYHLRKASKALEDMLNSPFTGHSGEGQTRDCPIVLDIDTHRFRNFLWFLYDSAYEWQVTPFEWLQPTNKARRAYKADPSLSPKWEDILVVADMFNMEDVCRVATYALDHNGGLPDVRKISLCVRHEVDKSWAFEAIKRVCARQEALTEEEACDMGLKMAINIASAREIAYKSSGGSITAGSAEVERFLREKIL